MLKRSFEITMKQKQKLAEVAETEKLENLSAAIRFVIDHYQKISDEPKVSERKPAAVQMANDPEVKRDINKILRISSLLGRSIDARAMAEVDFILEGEDEPL